jgi:hypothetical protein
MQKIILLTLLDGVDTYARSLGDTDWEPAVELGEMLVHVGVEPGSDQFHNTVAGSAASNCRSKAETLEFICAAYRAAVANVNKIQQVENEVEQNTLPAHVSTFFQASKN